LKQTVAEASRSGPSSDNSPPRRLMYHVTRIYDSKYLRLIRTRKWCLTSKECYPRVLIAEHEPHVSYVLISCPHSNLAQIGRLASPVSLSKFSWRCLKHLHYWLRKCEHIHTSCISRRQGRDWQLPGRLLFTKTRLVHRKKFPAGVEYTILCHFGAPRIIICNSNNKLAKSSRMKSHRKDFRRPSVTRSC
jgi:hypothetical protein